LTKNLDQKTQINSPDQNHWDQNPGRKLWQKNPAHKLENPKNPESPKKFSKDF